MARSQQSRDVYANLLRDTRGLRRDQAGARDAWFAALGWERKEETLFELEMLLKGLACFGNARNHPGPPRRTAAVAHDFHEELRIVRDALERVVVLVRQLLGPRDRAYAFSRYLESVLPEDAERSRLIKEQLTQDTPEESLFVLRNAFGSFVDLTDGVLRLGRVSNRLYLALHHTITREIGRNAYFNPLVALEFQPELDRIRQPQVLETLSTLELEAAHRVVALTFLTLFRCLRYTALVDQYAAEPASTRRSYVILATLRSDLRTLTRFLGGRAAEVIADGFEQELMSTPMGEMAERRAGLSRNGASLISLRGTLQGMGNSLRVEVRKVFERDLPAADSGMPAAELGPQLVVATAQIRATLHHAIRTLCLELRPGEAPPELDSPAASRREASARLRRDVWMFTQVLRAFLAKARATAPEPDHWTSMHSFQFVREFLTHFRAIGYQLVRSSDYDRLDRFLATLEDLRDVDLLDPARLEQAVEECRAFFQYLEMLFVQVSRRAELRGAAFDKKAAADTLRIYLDAAS